VTMSAARRGKPGVADEVAIADDAGIVTADALRLLPDGTPAPALPPLIATTADRIAEMR
jgi:hypothetical protein